MKNTKKITRKLLFVFLFFSMISFGQKKSIPQEIEPEGPPELEYTINNKTIALDGSSSGSIIMKFNGKLVMLKTNKSKTSKLYRIYENKEYTVIFSEIKFGECAGEGKQNITGKITIQNREGKSVLYFDGSDALFSSKKCCEFVQ
jgi:hypothetical protein